MTNELDGKKKEEGKEEEEDGNRNFLFLSFPSS